MRVLMIDHWSKDNMYTLELCSKLGELVDLDLLTVDNSMQNDNSNYRCFKQLLGYGHKKGYTLYFKYLKTLFKHFSLVLSKKYDCVHVQTFKTSVEIMLYILLKPLIKKLVLTVHNVLPHEQKKFDYLLYSNIYKRADKLIVHNDQTKIQLLKLFNLEDKKISVVPHGIYSAHRNVKEPKSLNKNSKCNFLFFGLIREYKGIDVLIEAINMLPEEFRQKINVKIVGNNVEKIDFNQILESKNLSQIISVVEEFIPENQIAQYFEWADAAVLPYKKISGSGALLMSYTFQKSVIVSDLPAFIEETEHGKTGLIFKSEDPSDLCEKLITYMELDSTERKKFIANIREIVKRKYNWEMSALLTYNFYRK